jgi:hypothetical protein
MDHVCHAIGCGTLVEPKYLMCRSHWSMVPGYLQNLIYTTYNPGQENSKTPSRVWLKYAKQAITHVKEAEMDSE